MIWISAIYSNILLFSIYRNADNPVSQHYKKCLRHKRVIGSRNRSACPQLVAFNKTEAICQQVSSRKALHITYDFASDIDLSLTCKVCPLWNYLLINIQIDSLQLESVW